MCPIAMLGGECSISTAPYCPRGSVHVAHMLLLTWRPAAVRRWWRSWALPGAGMFIEVRCQLTQQFESRCAGWGVCGTGAVLWGAGNSAQPVNQAPPLPLLASTALPPSLPPLCPLFRRPG